MKKIIALLIVCIFSSAILYAQSIRTAFSERIVLNDFIGIPQHTFYGGESVTIHAYKKKGNRYHFLVETENYAASFNCNRIPFYASEKELKKLPSAIGSKAEVM